MKLKGKVAIVTGGARDIGRAVSLKLSEEGASVVINYCNSKDDAENTKKMIEAKGGKCIVVQGDMTKWEDAQRMVSETIKAFGPEIHVLANVVGGIVGRKPIEEQDENWYQTIFDINFKSVFLTIKAAIGHIPAGGSIINFSSQAARDGGGGGAAMYAASKGAISTYTRGLAKEFGPRNIRVNAVCPGMIATSFHDRFTKDEVRKNVANATPLRREGMANEVADLVAYLASDESSFLTGVNVDINGGMFYS